MPSTAGSLLSCTVALLRLPQRAVFFKCARRYGLTQDAVISEMRSHYPWNPGLGPPFLSGPFKMHPPSLALFLPPSLPASLSPSLPPSLHPPSVSVSVSPPSFLPSSCRRERRASSKARCDLGQLSRYNCQHPLPTPRIHSLRLLF